MGWTFQRKPDSPKAECDSQWTFERNGTTMRVLRSAFVGSVYYAAVEVLTPGKAREVFAAVTLTKRSRDPGFEWGTKEMDESVGPNEARCPRTILALLTPTTQANALEWRAKCEAYHAAAPAQRVKAAPGAIVLSGGTRYALQYPAGPRKGWIVTRVPDGQRFRMPAAQLNRATPAP